MFSLAGILAAISPWSALIVGIGKQINWKIAAPTIFAIMMLGFAYYKGYSEAIQASKAQELAREVAEYKAQAIRLNNAKVDAEKRYIDIDAKNVELDLKVQNYVTEIETKARQGGGCRLSPADLRRLRGLQEH